jgi:hypothetical protein
MVQHADLDNAVRRVCLETASVVSSTDFTTNSNAASATWAMSAKERIIRHRKDFRPVFSN